jgi:hypothetical protein
MKGKPPADLSINENIKTDLREVDVKTSSSPLQNKTCRKHYLILKTEISSSGILVDYQ